ncbi:MAG TPA: DNA repair protein RecN [Candidatus Acidoferrales bacterium]|nr:DNA repair protein RecN [Candidatus Acidoferrales bacterium]
MVPYIAELSVKDLALVSELRLELAPGLTVLTGETGAGKSMLVDALLAVIGGRVTASLLREGAERAYVEAAFTGVRDEDLVLAREIASGRSPARVDGRTVPVSSLAETGEDLVAIHGQGDQLRLARPAMQRDVLDAFGAHDALRARVADAHAKLAALRRERESLGGDPRERERRAALLAHEVEEIRAAKLRPDEERELEAELGVARSAEKLREAARAAHELLAGDRASARDRLALAERELRRAAEMDARLSTLLERAIAQVSETDELASELRRYADGIENDPRRLADLEARSDLLYELRRKYGDDVAAIVAHGERAAAELAALRNSETRLAQLDDEERAATAALAKAAKALHDARAKAGAALASAVEAQLKDLALARCTFAVALTAREPDATGADDVRFLIAPNPGEPAKPIDEIASGGELSRIMLALEVTLAANDRTPVLVFDEVDAGVGGRVGETLGRALWSLARHHQVMVVSHLPQVAAYADQHISVRKEVRKGRTHVTATRLGERESVDELADMLGAGGARSLAAGAKELRDSAKAWKARR